MITITPKLTSKEIEKLRERVDRRGGMNIVSKAIGITRNTLRTSLVGGTCSDETAKKIRRFLKRKDEQVRAK